MNDVILNKIKEAFENICPFDVRLSHSRYPLPKDKPVIIIGIESICTEKVQTEGGCKRFPLTACISVKASVPFKWGAGEIRRIAAAYILPVMSELECSITGFSESKEIDKITEGRHTLEINFKIKGVYTACIEVGA